MLIIEHLFKMFTEEKIGLKAFLFSTKTSVGSHTVLLCTSVLYRIILIILIIIINEHLFQQVSQV